MFGHAAVLFVIVFGFTSQATASWFQPEKTGACPVIQRPMAFKNCQNECYYHSECYGTKLCCASGCSRICIRPSRIRQKEPEFQITDLTPEVPKAGVVATDPPTELPPSRIEIPTGSPPGPRTPVVTLQISPWSRLALGQDATMTCNSTEPVSESLFVWVKDGKDIFRAYGTNGQLLKLRVTRSNPGNYECKVQGYGLSYWGVSNRITLSSPYPLRDDSLCRLPMDFGSPCSQAQQEIRWVHDNEKSSCLSFIHLGCGGNENNFRTQAECQASCHDVDQCPQFEKQWRDHCVQQCTCSEYVSSGRCNSVCGSPPVERKCVCSIGYARNWQGKCVTFEQCPKQP